ncbi:hypothetical protein VTK26DRAFT_6803 [Humicola hyalothermophila]
MEDGIGNTSRNLQPSSLLKAPLATTSTDLDRSPLTNQPRYGFAGGLQSIPISPIWRDHECFGRQCRHENQDGGVRRYELVLFLTSLLSFNSIYDSCLFDSTNVAFPKFARRLALTRACVNRVPSLPPAQPFQTQCAELDDAAPVWRGGCVHVIWQQRLAEKSISSVPQPDFACSCKERNFERGFPLPSANPGRQARFSRAYEVL